MKKRGFTLIETMVTMTVFSIGMGILFTAIKLNEVYRSNVAVQMELYRFNKQAHDAIASELKTSSLSHINDTFFPGEIRFRVPFENATGYNIIWGAESMADYEIRYNLSGVDLVRRVWNVTGNSEVSNRTVASGFTNLTFTSGCNMSNNCVTIYTNATKTNFIGYNISFDARSMVALRNE